MLTRELFQKKLCFLFFFHRMSPFGKTAASLVDHVSGVGAGCCCRSDGLAVLQQWKKVGLLQQTSHSSQSGLSLSLCDGKTVDTHTRTHLLSHTRTRSLSLSPCLAYFLNGGCHFSAPLSVNLSACSLSLSPSLFLSLSQFHFI